jgi:voltage-gated potassium channel
VAQPPRRRAAGFLRRLWRSVSTTKGRHPHAKPGRRVLRLLALLVALLAVQVCLLMAFEGLSVWRALWLATTTIATVGYGDIAPRTFAGQLTTMVFLYVVAISLVALLAGELLEYRFDRRERIRAGRWDWKLRDHLLLLNLPQNGTESFLTRLVQQVRATPDLADVSIQVAAELLDFDADLRTRLVRCLSDLEVAYVDGAPNTLGTLELCGADRARAIVVLAENAFLSRSDSLTLDVLEHLRQLPGCARIVAECVRDENRRRFLRLGADSVLRPERAWPEMIVRAVSDPGSEAVLAELFTWEGAHTRRVDVAVDGLRWQDLVVRLAGARLGLAVAYLDREGTVCVNPPWDRDVCARALFLIVDQGDGTAAAAITAALEGAPAVREAAS